MALQNRFKIRIQSEAFRQISELVPSWHDFLERFTAEDGLDELGGCSGCQMVGSTNA